MKKLVFLSVLMFVVVFGAMAQGNRFYYGDKSDRKISQTLAKFDKQIAEYKAEVQHLETKNDKLAQRLRRTQDGVETGNLQKQKAYNDSLIGVYQGKINDVEFAKEEVLNKMAAKDKMAYVSSRGNNPQELLAASTAYSNMVYADAYAKKLAESGTSTVAIAGISMTGSVTNLYFRDVQVIVTGPNGFKIENYLPKKTGNFVFEIPGPGIYTATFLYHETGSGMSTAVVSKEATLNPNQSAFDPKGGKHSVCFTMLKGY